MTRLTRMLCIVLAAAIVLLIPFVMPSGAMLYEEKLRLDEEMPTESGWLDWLLPNAHAEAAIAPLPMDFSPGKQANPSLFTEQGYQDASITLRLETQDVDGVRWRIAYVDIKDPSQLRTAIAGNPGSSRVAMISSMAEKNNAIIAINANYMSNDPVKTSYEYRMGEKIRAKYNKIKDLLITDENGDLHVIVKSNAEEVQAFLDQGHTIINAFTFGPALIKDNALLELDSNYQYNPHGKEPRMAIGQMGPLSYVLVHAEGRTAASEGVTQIELADFMYNLGCSQAFNFDGGNSATMVYNGGFYQDRSGGNERAQSDMLYFATLVDPSTWK